ncbi:MAG: hypothetical protein V4773_17845 [Verrucomicrobiota bacterium]
MKLLFICSSLEPGRDGVGDYTRCLAAACIERGHECAVVALHDRHVSSTQRETQAGLELIRLSSRAEWSDRITRLRAEAARFNPHWISWQFVSYGYHPKGRVPTALIDFAASFPDRHQHLMLHELWIGLAAGESLTSRLAGWRQRGRLLEFVRLMRPLRFHTSNAAYQAALNREGLKAQLLELFGNIAICPSSPLERNAALMRFLPPEAKRRDAFFIALTFGTLHRQWQPGATFAWLEATAKRRGLKPALLISGRAGAHGAEVLAAARRRGIVAAESGEQDNRTISLLLQAADIGIAPHPWALIGKSGVAAAMREHGLPVVVPRDDWRIPHCPLPPMPHDGLLARLQDLDSPAAVDRWLAARRTPASLLPSVVDSFLASLPTPLPNAPVTSLFAPPDRQVA